MKQSTTNTLKRGLIGQRRDGAPWIGLPSLFPNDHEPNERVNAHVPKSSIVACACDKIANLRSQSKK
jgi:hypothetical protein